MDGIKVMQVDGSLLKMLRFQCAIKSTTLRFIRENPQNCNLKSYNMTIIKYNYLTV